MVIQSKRLQRRGNLLSQCAKSRLASVEIPESPLPGKAGARDICHGHIAQKQQVQSHKSLHVPIRLV